MVELSEQAAPPAPSQALDAVAREIGVSLGEARVAIEAFVEQPENATLIRHCAEELRRVRSVLQVVGVYGGALLAEEMEEVARYLATTVSERRNQTESLEALMRALVQLPNYVERVLGGGRDMPLVLLPLLNDLRAVRGAALLSEGTLMVLDLKSDRQPNPHDEQQAQSVSMADLARRMRPRFQLGLVGWIRAERTDQNLALLAEVAAQIEQAATAQSVFQLWWVIGAVVEALRAQGIEDGVSIKRLIGLGDRELRRLQEEDEARYAQAPPEELLNNLLFYVARATSQGPRVTAVRASFRLGELLPATDAIEQERENLAAPSVKLMHTVAAAIREDLAKVKDVLDIYQRRGGSAPEELEPQLEMLRKISDTLGVLGLGQQRLVVQEQVDCLEPLLASHEQPPEGLLVDIAAALIGVEDRLDEELVGTVMPRRPNSSGEPADVDFQHLQAAVLRESLVNLAQVKELVIHDLVGPARAEVSKVLLRGIEAGLMMLGKTRAVGVCARIGEEVSRLLQPEFTPSPALLEWVADAIVSLEYYMETVQAGRSDPWYMIENADAALDAARASSPAVAAQRAMPAAPHSVEPAIETDPELFAIFLEEAREEVERISRCFVAWDHNPLDQESLRTTRRSFHTLKGSGRVVGARAMHEFAWAIENLLNRVLEGSIGRSPDVLETLREAVRVMPELVAQLADGSVPASDIGAIAASANALAAGRPLDEMLQAAGSQPVTPSEAPAPEASAQDGPATAEIVLPPSVSVDADDTDYQLRDIYARETDSHVALVREFLARALAEAMPTLIPEPVYRACHTLAGSSRMADARHGIRLAQPLDHWLRKAFDAGMELTPEELALVGDCMAAMESVSRHLDESTGFFVAIGPLADRIAAADTELDRRISQQRLAAATAPEPAVEVVPPAPPPASFDYSPEIASIFADEATELLEGMQSAMAAITPASVPEDAVQALKRPLHTLKGGARLAGILTMGDLAHEVESLITRIELGLAPWGTPAFEALQAGLDEIARMRDFVVAGEPVPAAVAITARLQGVDGSVPPEEAATPAALAMPEPVAAEPVAEAAAAPVEFETPVAVVLPPLNAVVAVWRADPLPFADIPQIEAAEQPDVFQAEPVIVVEPIAIEPPLVSVATLLAPPGREAIPAVVERVEMARVDPELLDQLLNTAGDVSVGRARVEQQLGSIDFNLGELARTVTRLKDQLRKLEIETEAQILHRHENETTQRTDFDPLELDRYSSIQQFSRGLAETASDVASIQGLLESMTKDAQALLQQQGRAVVEMQNGLMRTRMVPFQRHVQRLTRIVRQTAAETQKQVELVIEGASGEFDRQVLERMLPPLEHLLRNAVVHGIESPAARIAQDKPATGRVTLNLKREGGEFSLVIVDDGAGMDLAAIRARGVATGLIHPTQQLSDEALLQLVLEPGFSTAGSVTQAAGRGVGMDVVATEVKKLGGSLNMASVAGQGSTFSIRLPFTLAVSQALVVRIGEECYALPLPTVEGVVRLPAREIAAHLGDDVPPFVKDGYRYRLQPLSIFVGATPQPLPDPDVMVPVVLVRAGEHSTGLVADELIGSREIVVKSVGPQIASIRGISGATILGDGRVAIILDIGALLRAEWRGRAALPAAATRAERRVTVLVVDDSITVRRVTQRLLERNGLRVVLARDGIDAMALMQDMVPDVILLDIEMPRMDGYEVATQVRSDPRTRDVPIIMITSRMGDKHRARAMELGVDDYLGKPYQEGQLLEAIQPLVTRRFQAQGLPVPVLGA